MRDSEQSHPDKVGKKLSCRFIYTKEEEEEEAQQTIVRIFRVFLLHILAWVRRRFPFLVRFRISGIAPA
jgi:hypothetical protein